MELTRDALLQVIKAERLSWKLSDGIQCLMAGTGRAWNMADEIHSKLADMIAEISGENRDVDFEESDTQIVLRSEISNEAVADIIERMADKNEPKQPKPNLVNRNQFEEMLKRYGGYNSMTPEGDWK